MLWLYALPVVADEEVVHCPLLVLLCAAVCHALAVLRCAVVRGSSQVFPSPPCCLGVCSSQVFPCLYCQSVGSCGVCYGVVYEIAEYAVEEAWVGCHHYLVGECCPHSYAFLAELQCCVVECRVYDVADIDILHGHDVVGGWRCAGGVYVVEFCQRCHVEQQLCHALALCVASLQEVLAFLLWHVGVGEDALEVSVYACRRCLQLVSGVLCELSLYAYLLLLAVSQFPVECYDGV